MPNNLEALKALKTSAEKQNRELESFIKEIHKQSLEQLVSDLTDITEKKLNKIEKNINSTMENIADQNKSRYSLKVMIWTSISIAIIFLLIGVVIADYTPKHHDRIMWQVPKEMRYEDKGVRYIKSQETYRSQDQKTTYIRIGE